MAVTAAEAGATKLGEVVGAENVSTRTILNGTKKIDINNRSWLSSVA